MEYYLVTAVPVSTATITSCKATASQPQLLEKRTSSFTMETSLGNIITERPKERTRKKSPK